MSHAPLPTYSPQNLPDDSDSTGGDTTSTNSLPALARLPEDWQSLLVSWGERPYRAQQIFRWIFAQRVLDPDKMSNLPASLRERLNSLPFDKLPEVEVVLHARAFKST